VGFGIRNERSPSCETGGVYQRRPKPRKLGIWHYCGFKIAEFQRILRGDPYGTVFQFLMWHRCDSKHESDDKLASVLRAVRVSDPSRAQR
jgi:hypothetical protein